MWNKISKDIMGFWCLDRATLTWLCFGLQPTQCFDLCGHSRYDYLKKDPEIDN